MSSRPELSCRYRAILFNVFCLPAGLLLSLAISGCSANKPQTGDPSSKLSAYRVREDFTVALNADSGWAQPANTPALVQADKPFRLRLEVEHNKANEPAWIHLQVRRNEGAWQPLAAENFPQPAKELELNFAARTAKGNRQDHWQFVQGVGTALAWQREVEIAGENQKEKGYLQVKAGKQRLLALGVYETHWEPVEFAADIRFPEGASRPAGVVFAYRDEHHYARVDIEPDVGLRLVQVESGAEKDLANYPFNVRRGVWSELKIIREESEVVVEYADETLVLRQRLEDSPGPPRFGVFIPEEGALDLSAVAIEGLPRSPRISIIKADTFAHGDVARDLLAVSPREFAGGAGLSFADKTPALTREDGQSEWEIPLVIRRFSDGAALNKTGDRFEFRLLNKTGDALPMQVTPTVTLAIPVGHLGGTFVETPGRIGPWQASNGDYYFLMEPSETDNVLMTVKSTDGGKSWTEADPTSRPATGDLEGFASTLAGHKIHMLHQTSEHVFYHVFRMSDHPAQPDTWAIRDERLASPLEPPTQVADIAVRSDGSVIAVYGGPRKIHYRIRSPQGLWSDETVIDAEHSPDLSGPMLVKDDHDVVHLAYTGSDGTAWYRQLNANNQLGPRRQVAAGLGRDSEDIGSILPLVYLPELNSISIIYRIADGTLWERQISLDGDLGKPLQVTRRAVVQNAVDSEQSGADAIGFENEIHVLFIEQDTGRLFHTSRRNGGEWSEPQVQVKDANVQWVRGTLLNANSGQPIYGYVYDAGSDGGSGMNRFGQVLLKKTAAAP